MASPFRLFRKHVKPLLVLFGVLIIFVFVIGDSLSVIMGSGSERSTPSGSRKPGAVAVRWDGGKLTNAELSRLVMRTRILNALQRQILEEGARAVFAGGGTSLPRLRVEPLNLPERLDQGAEQELVLRQICAAKARELGMQVSDGQVVSFLQQLGRGYVSVDNIRQMISRLQVGTGVATVDYVLNGLREELLVRNYLASYWFARYTVTPDQRWEDWLKMNDRVIVEAAAIPIEMFLVDVPEPTEEELKEFFEKYKDRVPRPDRVMGIEMPSPEPGFAVPRRVELQFVAAEYAKLLDQAESEVTDEEIEQFYEDNKDIHFIQFGTDLLDDLGGAATDESFSADTDTNASTGTGDAAAEDTNEATQAESSAGSTTSDTATSDDGAATRGTAQPATEEEEEEEETNAADEASSSDLTPGDAESNAANDSAGEGEATSEPSTRYQPLEKVRDQIRREIADIKVSERISKLMGQLENELDAKYANYLGSVLDAEDEGEEPPPPPAGLADLSVIAKEHNLEYKKTAPISQLELASMPIGSTHRTEEANVQPESRVRFRYLAFATDWEPYEPLSLQDTDNNRYLVMKTADIPGNVPTFDEIRDEVVTAWRRQKAAELALKHAEKEAKEAESVGSLEEFFASDENVKVTKSDFFSEITAGSVSRETNMVQSFRLSQPEGIKHADYEMLSMIFDLAPGEVGAALNHDHSIAYLLRVVEHELTPAELQQAFLSEADSWYGYAAWLRFHLQQATSALLFEILESANVDWTRPADQPYYNAETGE